MSDQVGNPEDRFSHVAAHSSSETLSLPWAYKTCERDQLLMLIHVIVST